LSKEIHDDDVLNVLEKDGVPKVVLSDYENKSNTNLKDIISDMGAAPWAVRVVYNEVFGGVLICQNPGEGNRLHYHHNADECWVIMKGDWEWFIEGQGTKRVTKDDIVVVQKGVPHKITCIGSEPGIRFAITKPDVDHVYAEED
jgi:mannose-6-phosphate isomerase-like protein (cupin superfamily)